MAFFYLQVSQTTSFGNFQEQIVSRRVRKKSCKEKMKKKKATRKVKKESSQWFDMRKRNYDKR